MVLGSLFMTRRKVLRRLEGHQDTARAENARPGNQTTLATPRAGGDVIAALVSALTGNHIEQCPLCNQPVSTARLPRHIAQKCPRRKKSTGKAPETDPPFCASPEAVKAGVSAGGTASESPNERCVHGMTRKFRAPCTSPQRPLAISRRKPSPKKPRRAPGPRMAKPKKNYARPTTDTSERRANRHLVPDEELPRDYRTVSGGLPSLGRRR